MQVVKNLKKQSAHQASNDILKKYIGTINNKNMNKDLDPFNEVIDEEALVSSRIDNLFQFHRT